MAADQIDFDDELDDAYELDSETVERILDAVDSGDGVVVVVDMFGSSPSNLSLPACASSDRKILYGANLPMLVKLAKSREGSIETATKAAMAAGRKYIDCIDGKPAGGA